MITVSTCWFPGGSFTTINVKEYNEYLRHLKKFPLYEVIVYERLTVVGLASDGKRGIVADFCICGEFVIMDKNEKPRVRRIEAAGYILLCEGLLTKLEPIQHPHSLLVQSKILDKLPGLRNAALVG